MNVFITDNDKKVLPFMNVDGLVAVKFEPQAQNCTRLVTLSCLDDVKVMAALTLSCRVYNFLR